MANVKFDFTGNNYVVTGASSGMGYDVAKKLVENGANVLVIARRLDLLEELKKYCPDRVFVSALDVCNYEDMEKAVKLFVEKVGKLDGVVHAAGINLLTPLKAFDETEARKIHDITFWAGVKLLQICTKVKVSNVGASYVMFASVGAQDADKGTFAYASSKSSIRISVRAFAKEFASRKLRFNTISPGLVRTDMSANLEEIQNLDLVNQKSILGLGQPSDVTGSVLFLLSDGSKWITGTDLIVDGGFLA